MTKIVIRLAQVALIMVSGLSMAIVAVLPQPWRFLVATVMVFQVIRAL